MFYTDLSGKSDADFKRLTGVSRPTFAQMLDAYTKTKRDFGRPSKLPYADQLLLTLMLRKRVFAHWRENRTLFHTGQTYRISESYTWKIVRAVENSLISDGRFRLPGKRSLLSVQHTPERIRMDVTETPIQRPQKNRGDITAGRRSNTR